jgi:hypothetical protein
MSSYTSYASTTGCVANAVPAVVVPDGSAKNDILLVIAATPVNALPDSDSVVLDDTYCADNTCVVAALFDDRLVNVATPATAAVFVVPAVVTAVGPDKNVVAAMDRDKEPVSGKHTLLYTSRICTIGCVANAVPAVVVPDGCWVKFRLSGTSEYRHQIQYVQHAEYKTHKHQHVSGAAARQQASSITQHHNIATTTTTTTTTAATYSLPP